MKKKKKKKGKRKKKGDLKMGWSGLNKFWKNILLYFFSLDQKADVQHLLIWYGRDLLFILLLTSILFFTSFTIISAVVYLRGDNCMLFAHRP